MSTIKTEGRQDVEPSQVPEYKGRDVLEHLEQTPTHGAKACANEQPSPRHHHQDSACRTCNRHPPCKHHTFPWHGRARAAAACGASVGTPAVHPAKQGVPPAATLCRRSDAADFDFLLLAGRITLLNQDGFAKALARGAGVTAATPFESGGLAIGARLGANSFYEPASPAIMERARRLEAVCARHQLPLPGAALQFPLSHPVVESVLAGYRKLGMVQHSLEHASHVITAPVWEYLRGDGLFITRVVLPGR